MPFFRPENWFAAREAPIPMGQGKVGLGAHRSTVRGIDPWVAGSP